jgi:hypothetical protein
MITREDLAAAVEDGLLTEEQAARLIARAELSLVPTDIDDERFRFLNGFNDVFLALGIVLIAGALAAFMSVPKMGWPVVAGVAVIVMWGLAEIVIRKFRAVLPAIFISIAITIFAGLLFSQIFSPTTLARDPFGGLSARSLTGALSLLAFVIVFYWRFRLPFTFGTIGAVAYGCALLLFFQTVGSAPDAVWLQLFMVCAGLALFAVAVAYDFSDPARVTRRSDCSFWLHMVAGPTITHGLLAQFATKVDVTSAAAMIGGFVLFAVVSLVIDRRVPLVSVLLYLGIAIGYLFSTVAVKSALTIGATLLVLGIIVVTMGLAWRPLRRMLLTPLRRFEFSNKLPPVRPA